MGLFIAGIVIAILASSLVSTVISLQYSFGPQGSQGPQGLSGQNGLNGAQGIQGPQGVQGSQGVQGLKGDTGLQGPEGNVSLENIAGWLPSPAYDSGWTLISGIGSWHNFTHGLNTKELIVYMLGKTEEGDIYPIGQYDGGSMGYWRIASPNEILVTRTQLSIVLIRVLAWEIPQT